MSKPVFWPQKTPPHSPSPCASLRMTTEAEDPLSTQDQQTVAEVEEGEELEDLDLAEGMDTAEGANNNDGLC